METVLTPFVWYYYYQTNPHESHRYKSWEYCYRYFMVNNAEDRDLAGLHLGFYLASWGMFRGASGLLQKDYKIYVPLIDILKQYSPLSKEAIGTSKYLRGVFGLKQDLYNYFKSNDIISDPSDTLISKIILGTLGITPAWDRFFRKGLKEYGFSNIGMTSKTFIELGNFIEEHKEEIQILQSRIRAYGELDFDYPTMKIIDMFFWQFGQPDDD